jgi:hypothetical protein
VTLDYGIDYSARLSDSRDEVASALEREAPMRKGKLKADRRTPKAKNNLDGVHRVHPPS